MNEYVLPSELSLLMVVAQLTRPDGTTLDLSSPEISGTTYNFITRVNSFGDSDVGNYLCTATVTPRPTATLLTGMGQLESDPVEIMIGMWGNTIVVQSDIFTLCPVLYFIIGIPTTTRPSDTSTNTKNSVNTFSKFLRRKWNNRCQLCIIMTVAPRAVGAYLYCIDQV